MDHTEGHRQDQCNTVRDLMILTTLTDGQRHLLHSGYRTQCVRVAGRKAFMPSEVTDHIIPWPVCGILGPDKLAGFVAGATYKRATEIKTDRKMAQGTPRRVGVKI